MRLSPSDIASLYRPTYCELRVYLREKAVAEAEPSAFDKVLASLGRRHERAHLATLGVFEDISTLSAPERAKKTVDAVQAEAPVIYQGELRVETSIDGKAVTIVGRPDYMIFDFSGYVIRDSKLSRKVDEDHHIEISLQLQLYGWLYESTFGTAPTGLQVHAGKGDLIDVPYDGGQAALAELSRIVSLKGLASKPYEPVGWSKCEGCGFSKVCWEEAESRQDVALVMEVDQGLARALNAIGTVTAQQLRDTFTFATLSELKRPWGEKVQKVGKKAEKILLYADVLCSGRERVLAPAAIPDFNNYVMFDLEGMPPHLDELDQIYLWGMQVFGARPGAFIGVTAGFGIEGDKEGWLGFLQAANKIFAEHGDIPFVHWHHYERTHITQYVDRFGDVNGIAARILTNLLDLLPITKGAIALPLPTYSLKVVEKYVGFNRTQDEYGGSWAMAKFIEATETNDADERNRLMSDILKYNEEDLMATWAVFEWLRSKAPSSKAAIP